jgi:hypothetical protein
VPAATVVVVTAVVTVTVTAATPTAAPLSPGSSRASEALLLFRVQRHPASDSRLITQEIDH